MNNKLELREAVHYRFFYKIRRDIIELKMIVSDEVLKTIKDKGVCYAKNDTTFSDYAYQFMKDMTGFKGLFFAIHNNTYMKMNPERINEIISMSNTHNRWALYLNVPDNEVYAHDYYTFTDLIFYEDEGDYETVEIIEADLKRNNTNNAEVQCLINRIEQAWCKKIEAFNSKV